MAKIIPIIFSSLYLFLFNFSFSAAQTPINDNLCTQVQCVKIQNGYLWTLSSDNVTYTPYFIKAVGYQPMPIGRHPSDWGYASSDPRSAINNIYNDPAILNRDFTLLQQMNANTIRLWNASNVQAPSGEFTNTMTMTTLDTAQQYGLKIIPGFWVNPLTFDANNNIESTDNLGNPLTAQQIINNFVTFVNTFKGSPGVLFWAIGNENNLQQPQMTPPQLTAWYALVNNMAQAAHNAEGAYFHPVALVNGEIGEIGNSADGATDSDLPYLDIWGANIYRGESFGALFSQYASQSKKPFWISEYGIDAFATSTDPTIVAEINNWQNQMMDPSVIAQEGSEDQATQSSWDGSLWNEVLNNSPVTIGASVMEYSDEWWQPNEWMCVVPNPYNDPTIQAENAASESYCVSTHSNFGSPFPAFPDDYNNGQWFGVMSISPNPVAGGPDIMTPRQIYSNLQSQWQANPWSQLTLTATGSGIGTISSPSSIFGAALNCNFSSGSSSGTCSAIFPLNQPVTLDFSSNNNATVTNWGVNGCAKGSTTCSITPNTNTGLNVVIAAPATPTVAITSPFNGSYMVAGSNLTVTAMASEIGGTISKVSFYNGTSLLGTVTSGTGGLYSYTLNNVPAGDYVLTAVAMDSNGGSGTSAAVEIVAAVASPMVFITTPANSSSFTAGSNISITAFADENFQGTITKVAFYNGTTLLGTVSSTNYDFTYVWSNAPAGTYNITAVATDSAGTSTTSSPVSMTVTHAPPASMAVAITSPVNGSYMVAGSNLTVTAMATETGGTISRVSFYNGASLLGTVTSGTGGLYSYTLKNAPAGDYVLTAVATDSNGGSGTSPVVEIVAAAASPVVFITSPANSSSFTAGSNISITAFADENFQGTISKVAFYNGNALLGTVTSNNYDFTYVWSNAPAGTYNITAIATDSAGTSTTSSPVSITISGSASLPVVAITSPINPDYMVAGSNLTITATAVETGGTISQVAFYNGTALLATVTIPAGGGTGGPYSYTWNNVPAGYYNLTAVATDSLGAKSISIPVSVAASPASPVAIISSPISQTTFTAGSNISINAFAMENYGGTINNVAFYNGTVLLGTVTSNSLVFSYIWTNVPGGTYNLTAVATDSLGSTGTSMPVSITVAAASSTITQSSNIAVNGTSIESGSLTTDSRSYASPADVELTANINVNENSNDNISKVQFFNGTTLLGTVTSSPYTFSWTDVPEGTYNLTAVATDNSGYTTSFSAPSITVNS